MITAIIQARMGATRLPGKVLKTVQGKTLLAHLIERVRRASTVSRIIIATTDTVKDDPVVLHAKEIGVEFFRGSEEDVLARYYGAAHTYAAVHIARITADCPLMDHRIVDLVAKEYLEKKPDYAANINPPTFPDGMDIEIFSMEALTRAHRNARLCSEREHVTPYIRNHPELFSVINIESKTPFPDIRLTVDHPEDFALVQQVYDALYPENPDFSLEAIAEFLSRHPELARLNNFIPSNEGMLKSLAKDAEIDNNHNES